MLQYGLNLRLLEHNFTEVDFVSIRGLAPWKIMATIFLIPRVNRLFYIQAKHQSIGFLPLLLRYSLLLEKGFEPKNPR